MALIQRPDASAIGFSGPFCVTVILVAKFEPGDIPAGVSLATVDIPYAVASIVSEGTEKGRVLRGFRFVAPEDLPLHPSAMRERVADLPQKWVDAEAQRFQGDAPLAPGHISRVLGSPIGREFLTGHLSVLYSRGVPELPSDEGSIVRKTARLYREFISWGETAPAAQIALLTGANPMTIRNRLSEARLRGWLEAPGHGARRG